MTQLYISRIPTKTRTDDPGCDDDACEMHGGGCEIVAVHGDVAQPYAIVAQLVGPLYNTSPSRVATHFSFVFDLACIF